MNQFQGFPSGGRVEYTSIPNAFFSSLLPQITDMAELKTTLYIIAILYTKKGAPRFVTVSELLGNVSLMAGLKSLGGQPEAVLRSALKLAAERGTLICIPVSSALSGKGQNEDIYLLNTESDRAAAEKIRNGEISLAGLKVREAVPVQAEPLPDIYTLYEQNVGLITPMVADELKDAEKIYSVDWIRDAIKEAALHNKRSIKYILKILENWSVEGRSDGTYQRDTKKTDPDKYIKGKYGHMVQR
jgi:DnaD/phage-associated family protein